MSTDEKLRNACRDWLVLNERQQDETNVMPKAERSRMEGVLRLIIRTRSTDMSDLNAKVQVFECFDNNHDTLCRSICEDVKALAKH